LYNDDVNRIVISKKIVLYLSLFIKIKPLMNNTKKIVALLCLISISFTVVGQRIYPRAQQKVTHEAAKKLLSELKQINPETEKQIVVMPIYDKNNAETEHSVYFSEKIVHSLNSLIDAEGLNFSVRFYKEDPKLANFITNNTGTGVGNDYYKDLFEKYKVDFFIGGSYLHDSYNGKILIEKLTIFANYVIPGTDRKSISAKDASVTNDPGPAPIYRSALVPGWGQIYKDQKTKGYIFLSSFVALGAGAFVAQNMYSYNYNEAIKNRKSAKTYLFYLDKSDSWYTVRNSTFVAVGAVYAYSLVDAIASKRKRSNNDLSLLSSKKYQIAPIYTGNSLQLGLGINLNY